MDLTTENKKREEFREILRSLAKSQEVLKTKEEKTAYIERLEALYYVEGEDNFKHFYSDIFSEMSEVNADADNGNIDVLSQNIQIIRGSYKSRNEDSKGNIIDIRQSLKKLSDHVNLEAARFRNVSAQIEAKTQSLPISDLETNTKAIKTNVDKATEKIAELSLNSEKLERELLISKEQYITILGIFSSVVISFTAGTAFSMSVLENINKATIYRIVLIVLALGFVLLNIIFALFYYVGQLTNRKITACPIIISDAIIIVRMLAVMWSWSEGFVEKRNYNLEKEISGYEQISSNTQEQWKNSGSFSSESVI